MIAILTAALISIQPLWYPLSVNPIDLPVGKTEFAVIPIWPVYGAFLYNSRAKVFFHAGWISVVDLDWRWFGFDYWRYIQGEKLALSVGLKRIQLKVVPLFALFEELEKDYTYLWEFTGEIIYRMSANTFGISLGYSRAYYHPIIFNLSYGGYNTTAKRASFFYSFMRPRENGGLVCDIGMWGDSPYAGIGGVIGSDKVKLDLSLFFTLDEHDKLGTAPWFRLWIR